MAARSGRHFLYLGYWIRELRNMAYKARFAPAEVLGERGWLPVPRGAALDDPLSDGSDVPPGSNGRPDQAVRRL